MAETPTERDLSSSEVLETKCGKCALVCSVAPVSEESGSFYCGRCRPNGTPNRRFEDAAKKVVFPCAFGCGTYLADGIALEHEVFCVNRTVVCPFMNCMTTSTLQDLHKHIKACHAACYDQETTELYHRMRTDSDNYLHCITFDKFVLLVFVGLSRTSDIVDFEYSACLIWPQESRRKEFYNMQLRFDIEVPESDLKVTKLIQCKNLGNYYDRSHCVNCLSQRCDKILHENKCNLPFHNIPLNVKDKSEIDLFYTIKLYKKETGSGKVLDSLECPVCMDYMMNEIYLCENGHSLCGKCNERQSSQKCPICRGNMPNKRNYSMEKLANQINEINLPCRKKTNGCTFVGLLVDVLVHEKSCKY